MAQVAAHKQIFAAWREHKAVGVSDTGFVLEQALRSAHPGHHLTRVSGYDIDPLQFAHAGHARAVREEDDGFDVETTRTYCPPGSRLEAAPAVLSDDVKFARWRYSWSGVDFIVYEASWRNPYTNCSCHEFFILAPLVLDVGADGPLVSEGNHRKTDTLILAVGNWSRELHDEIYVFDDMHWTKSKSLWRSVQSASWDDVILDPAMKASIIADVEGFFDSREMYEMLKVPWKRGVILHGVPGNGKTVTIKALINTLSCRKGTSVQSLYVKSLDSTRGSKWSIQRIFEQARLVAPCLLIFEDLDSLVADKTRSYFLNEVDGLDANDGILMIGSTNHLDRLDPAVTKRPSRFDRKYHYTLPARPERVAYAHYWRKKFEGFDAVDFPEEVCDVIADMTEGYSFAYMKELFITSLLHLARGGHEEEDRESSKAAPAAKLDAAEQTAAESGADKPGSSGADEDTASDTVVVEASQEPGTEVVSVKKKDAKKETPATVAMRDVEIPESLRDNALVKVIKAQAELLLSEIDNAAKELEQSKIATERGPVSMRTRLATPGGVSLPLCS